MDYLLAWGFAALLLGLCGRARYRLLYLHWRTSSTTATVVELVRDAAGEATVYFPVIAFTTHDGAAVLARRQHGAEEDGRYFRVGQPVAIRYSPRNPQHFSIRGYEVAGLLLALLTAGVLAGLGWSLIR